VLGWAHPEKEICAEVLSLIWDAYLRWGQTDARALASLGS